MAFSVSVRLALSIRIPPYRRGGGRREEEAEE